MPHKLTPGTITQWSGSIGSIPPGWALCDGNNGTPDLRDRFIMGALGTYAPGTTAGVNLHLHTMTGDGHQHTVSAGAGLKTNPLYAKVTWPSDMSGSTDQTNRIPNYYALAFIMQLP